MANAHRNIVLFTSIEIAAEEQRTRRQAQRQLDMQRKQERLRKHFDRRAGR